MMKVGIEIEGVFNYDLVENIEVGDYHRGFPFGEHWQTQSDSSIRCTEEFDRERAIEFVSNPLETKEQWDNAINEFRNQFPKDKQLFEVVYFNGSTGCHFHFSFPKGQKVYTVAMFEHYVELRNLFFDKIKESTKLSNKVKAGILRKYFRDYASEITKDEYVYSLLNSAPSRKREFNLRSDQQGKGLEWRSINLNGVSTWEEFYEVLNIAYECVQDFEKILKKDVKEQKKIELKEKVKEKNKVKIFKVKKYVQH